MNDQLLLFILASAIIGALIGIQRGHNVAVSMLVSALLFPIGVFLVLLIPGKKKCPRCHERIQRKARACRFCGYDYSSSAELTAAPR